MNALWVITNVTEMQIASIVVIKFIANVKLDMMVMVINVMTSMNVAKQSLIARVNSVESVFSPE